MTIAEGSTAGRLVGAVKKGRLFDRMLRPLFAWRYERYRLADGTFPEWVRRRPNQLTAQRLLMPVPALAFLAGGWYFWPLLAIPAFAAVLLLFGTDAGDGPLARFVGNATDDGATKDALYDKVAAGSMYVVCVVLIWHLFPAMLVAGVVLVASRTAADLILALVAWDERRLYHLVPNVEHPSAGPWGKYKSGFDITSIALASMAIIVAGFGLSGDGIMRVALWVLLGACILAPLSIWEHLLNRRRLRRLRRQVAL